MNAPMKPGGIPAPSNITAAGGMVFEVTRLRKRRGPLTKEIRLDDGGKLISDGSACVMGRGLAKRERLDLRTFADLIVALDSSEAIALGRLRGDLPDTVEVTTKARLEPGRTDAIARTSDAIAYAPGQPALVLIDVDLKGWPEPVGTNIRQAGGIRAALASVLPPLAAAARVVRKSTSTGISRSDTGQAFAGSNGVHIYLLVADGGDVERFLRTLHDRCWLAGLGWMTVGAGGQLLNRSLIDRSVYAGERLVFEGPPVMVAPLVQDQSSRTPEVHEGDPLDTRAACPDLTVVERSRLHEMQTKERRRLERPSAEARTEFVEAQTKRIVSLTGCAPDEARRAVERQCGGVLLPGAVLHFDDDEELGEVTVREILADPDRYVGETLADPLEGREYGLCKAKVMRRPDGSLWIRSFAHGLTTYEIKRDAALVNSAILAAPKEAAADVLVEMAAQAEISRTEEGKLKELVRERAGVGVRATAQRLKEARQEVAQRRAREARDRADAQRNDSRVRLLCPAADAPWLPQMEALNEVLGSAKDPIPPMRDVEGALTEVKLRRIPTLHALTPDGSNGEEAKGERLPPTDQLLLTRMNEIAAAEMIERYIEFTNPRTNQPVHLPKSFVDHFMVRGDGALPTVSGLSTLPIVLPDGTLLATQGLDRDRGVVFNIPQELLNTLPAPGDCNDAAVKAAFEFLVDVFLVDVLADTTGKCLTIALLLTLIERFLFDERPVFFVTAGRRGSGKTTLLVMLLMAITGTRPSAAAWSPSEEERRKALLAYLREGPVAILWDNIPRGAQITCPHIERACTSASMEDRVLGVSERAIVPTTAIQMFTGNNIRAMGDLASREVNIALEVDRADPENRPFVHPDPVAWTEANRGKILVAFYTLLMGNPALRPGANLAAAKTRFKTWYQVVGSTVEHAAALAGHDIDFGGLFLAKESEEESNASLHDVLMALSTKWPAVSIAKETAGFQATDVARWINDRESSFMPDWEKEGGIVLRDFLFPEQTDKSGTFIVSAKSVGRRLKKHCGEPVFTIVDGLPRSITLLNKPKPEYDPNAAAVFWMRLS